VNKADREGTDRTVADIESLLSLHAYQEGEWRPTIVRTQATAGAGLDELVDAIQRFSGQRSIVTSRRRQRAEVQLRAILSAKLLRQIESRVPAAEMTTLVDRIVARTIDPYSAAGELLGRAGG
jgi:LAO/AO transport system kinase